MAANPCNNCTERTMVCHSVCPHYFKFLKENEEEKEKIRQAKKAQNDFREARQSRFKNKKMF